MHSAVSLKRIQKERKAEAVTRQSAHVPAIGVEQDFRPLPWLFDRGSTAGRKENRDREQEQEYSPVFFDRIPPDSPDPFLR